ncbi:RNA-directed DNA polymerase (reverse transcriptase)-related family protein [Trema orientale]|uniref:RNA-directed DNA polymerase (Reverse transcriptase)-related family protein n=1 Tax=Trema orientale TaxID=63057 RepID=A0A2P5EZU3_TREOI|nr:RNA-directed DNA polymerase (reverse transcriptase)-related family protein [Trema orientale]
MGRLTLISSVGQAMPTYGMTTNRLPQSWGSNVTGNLRIHLRAWDHICKPKTSGGLGLCRIADYNRAFLVKWAWLLNSGSNALWAQVLRSKYLKAGTMIEATAKASDSVFWKAIIGVNDLLKKGACFIVGDGSTTNIWRDPWVPKHPTFRPNPTINPGPGFVWVVDFILPRPR